MVSTSYLIWFNIGAILLVAAVIWLRLYGERQDREAEDKRLDAEVAMLKGQKEEDQGKKS